MLVPFLFQESTQKGLTVPHRKDRIFPLRSLFPEVSANKGSINANNGNKILEEDRLADKANENATQNLSLGHNVGITMSSEENRNDNRNAQRSDTSIQSFKDALDSDGSDTVLNNSIGQLGRRLSDDSYDGDHFEWLKYSESSEWTDVSDSETTKTSLTNSELDVVSPWGLTVGRQKLKENQGSTNSNSEKSSVSCTRSEATEKASGVCNHENTEGQNKREMWRSDLPDITEPQIQQRKDLGTENDLNSRSCKHFTELKGEEIQVLPNQVSHLRQNDRVSRLARAGVQGTLVHLDAFDASFRIGDSARLSSFTPSLSIDPGKGDNTLRTGHVSSEGVGPKIDLKEEWSWKPEVNSNSCNKSATYGKESDPDLLETDDDWMTVASEVIADDDLMGVESSKGGVSRQSKRAINTLSEFTPSSDGWVPFSPGYVSKSVLPRESILTRDLGLNYQPDVCEKQMKFHFSWSVNKKVSADVECTDTRGQNKLMAQVMSQSEGLNTARTPAEVNSSSTRLAGTDSNVINTFQIDRHVSKSQKLTEEEHGESNESLRQIGGVQPNSSMSQKSGCQMNKNRKIEASDHENGAKQRRAMKTRSKKLLQEASCQETRETSTGNQSRDPASVSSEAHVVCPSSGPADLTDLHALVQSLEGDIRRSRSKAQQDLEALKLTQSVGHHGNKADPNLLPKCSSDEVDNFSDYSMDD